jgi:hypothetical protein
MNVSKPPFSAASIVHSIVSTTRSTGRPVDIRDRDPVGRDVGDVALLHEDDPAGVAEDRGDVGGEERFALPSPTTSGTSLRAPTSRSFSSRCMIASAYAPSSWRRAARGARAMSPS